jgi:hypothetical protein
MHRVIAIFVVMLLAVILQTSGFARIRAKFIDRRKLLDQSEEVEEDNVG